MNEFVSYFGSKEAEMEINGCKCIFNNPPAKKDSEAPNLPPHAPRKAYSVDEYPGCPTNWMHGSSKSKSYFVPVKAESGMWLDLNKCSNHTHHIAALISVQGVNPLTGMPLIDTAMRLEQYKHKCPKHDKEFGADLYCEECGYKWVPQNYLATTGTPSGVLWLDGFRADDGSVRQYYITEEEAKGIAAQIIGDKRVFAIGIAFYQSKERKPAPPPPPVYHYPMYKPMVLDSVPTKKYMMGGGDSWSMPQKLSVSNRSRGVRGQNAVNRVSSDAEPTLNFGSLESIESPVKQLEIGAGAKINQRVYADPENLDFWGDAPIGMLYINYVQESEAKRIIAVGKRSLKEDGFMAGLAVGCH